MKTINLDGQEFELVNFAIPNGHGTEASRNCFVLKPVQKKVEKQYVVEPRTATFSQWNIDLWPQRRATPQAVQAVSEAIEALMEFITNPINTYTEDLGKYSFHTKALHAKQALIKREE